VVARDHWETGQCVAPLPLRVEEVPRGQFGPHHLRRSTVPGRLRMKTVVHYGIRQIGLGEEA